jgi:hypothetical protein
MNDELLDIYGVGIEPIHVAGEKTTGIFEGRYS